MRLESALFSSRAGLDAHGRAIAVIGDNVANANTTGYRSSRVEFADILAAGTADGEGQMASGGSGAIVSRISESSETGVLEQTGRELDVGIGGRGYFVVGDPAQPNFTRNGAFTTDRDGNLTTQEGKPILGVMGAGVLGTDPLTTLNLRNLKTSGTPTGTISVYGNLNAGAVVAAAVPAAPASFQELRANASYVTNVSVFDSLGASHDVSIAFTKTGPGVWTAQAFIDGGDVGGTAGVPVQLGQNTTLTFGDNGQIVDPTTAVITAAPAYANGAAAGNFSINLGGFDQFARQMQTSSISQDGVGVGNILDYTFKRTGEIYANLDNGQTVLIGSVAIADFPNPGGLSRIGSSLYAQTESTGDMVVGKGGEGGRGEVLGRALERSTVDIANEFVNLVIYQRGYQANSQTLNAANELVRDTIALLR